MSDDCEEPEDPDVADLPPELADHQGPLFVTDPETGERTYEDFSSLLADVFRRGERGK